MWRIAFCRPSTGATGVFSASERGSKTSGPRPSTGASNGSSFSPPPVTATRPIVSCSDARHAVHQDGAHAERAEQAEHRPLPVPDQEAVLDAAHAVHEGDPPGRRRGRRAGSPPRRPPRPGCRRRRPRPPRRAGWSPRTPPPRGRAAACSARSPCRAQSIPAAVPLGSGRIGGTVERLLRSTRMRRWPEKRRQPCASAWPSSPAGRRPPRASRSTPRTPASPTGPTSSRSSTATPHGYFRFVNAAFAAETCRLFADVAASLPEVNLHGDAHVEQYAVTSLGRGLTDFDDCTRGEAVIDLVRFGASLLLAAREKGWAAEEERFVDEFLKGYRDGLRGGPREMRDAGAGHADPGRVQVGPRSRAAPGARPHRPGSPAARRLRGRGPRSSPSSSGSAASCPRGFFKVKRVGRDHHGGGQRARREVPDHLRGRHRRRRRTTWWWRRSRSATSPATPACAPTWGPRASSTASG